MQKLAAKDYDLHVRDKHCTERCVDVYLADDVDRVLDIRRGEINEERQDVDRLARRIAELDRQSQAWADQSDAEGVRLVNAQARIAELVGIIRVLWNDVDPLDYPEIKQDVEINLARYGLP